MSDSPKRFPDRDEIARVREEARRLAGRVMARRDMGKLVFLDLVDRSGRIQLLCPIERTGEIDVHLGDIVGVVASARSVGPTRIGGRPGGSQRDAPRIGSLVVQTSAAVTSKPTRKSQGSNSRRFASSGISQTHAGSR